MPSCKGCGDPSGLVETRCDVCTGESAERSAAAVVLSLFLTVLALGTLVVIYGGLMMMIGFWPFVMLVVAAAALKILIQKQ